MVSWNHIYVGDSTNVLHGVGYLAPSDSAYATQSLWNWRWLSLLALPENGSLLLWESFWSWGMKINISKLYCNSDIKIWAFLCFPGPNETPKFHIEVYLYLKIILQCNISLTHTVVVFFPIWCLMKTVILHCNGNWKYTVISRVDSSGIWVFRLDLGSTRMHLSRLTHLYSMFASYWIRLHSHLNLGLYFKLICFSTISWLLVSQTYQI